LTPGPVNSSFFAQCARQEDAFLVEKNRNLVLSRARMNLPYNAEEEFPLNCESGKIRFYREKMGIGSEEELLQACKEYITGMVWIYKYYFYGVPSWEWHYPYHFAPFMADLACMARMDVRFNMGKPLRAMEQLLAVLPPHSRALIPSCLHDIFENNKEMYPEDFKIDSFQKCMDWQAVPILPFIDPRKITSGFCERQSQLTFEESELNVVEHSIMYSRRPLAVKKAGSLYDALRAFEILECDEFCGKIYPLAQIDGLDEQIERFYFKYTNQAVAFTFDQRIKKGVARRR